MGSQITLNFCTTHPNLIESMIVIGTGPSFAKGFTSEILKSIVPDIEQMQEISPEFVSEF
jgi:hypothetical protein